MIRPDPPTLAERLRSASMRLRGRADVDRLRRAGATIGDGVFIAHSVLIDPDFAYLVTIGDRATLSIGVIVLAHDASTKHFINKTRIAPVTIGPRTFVGANSVVLPGVEIGEGSVVGAASVVRSSVPPGAVVGGNPARQLATIEEYKARHEAAYASRPTWPREGWTSDTGITPERIAEVRRALANGEGYID